MDQSNFNNIVSLARNTKDASKVELILNELADPEIVDVPDPYYGGEQGFENVYHLLDDVCTAIANRLTEN